LPSQNQVEGVLDTPDKPSVMTQLLALWEPRL
jgi:hypothetical protein